MKLRSELAANAPGRATELERAVARVPEVGHTPCLSGLPFGIALAGLAFDSGFTTGRDRRYDVRYLQPKGGWGG